MSRVVALCGGVGGAKLALGLQQVLPTGELTVVVNTGDDFEHLGLSISPDVDTTVYTLAGLAHPEQGWGRRDETWSCVDTLEALGGETWFRLGVRSAVLPMSDAPVRTRVSTTEGVLAFQHYFVARRCEPRVDALHYEGAEAAAPSPAVLQALASPALEAVIVCPSNPWLSIAPMLAIPALGQALAATRAPVVAVSPLVGGQAVKGPTTKIMAELGLPVSASEVARGYGALIDGFLLDERDRGEAASIPHKVALADTLMRSLADRERLARAALDFAAELSLAGAGS